MKLPMPTGKEIYDAAVRAEDAIHRSTSRTADVYIIENAIQHIMRMMIDRMDIQIPTPLMINLRKD